ncbi:MAG: 3-deoxy-manno-octulosonate cytidylyltransferase [Candidatus Cloacimonetes bacterium]|nr:3-deoxy-manno-octulosonate cytidylyltransferase [Candidatus Cloacimonadota bacterium]
MSSAAIIPARYASVRFPGKPLAHLCGKPIIQHVYERVLHTRLFDAVIIATDDDRISECCKKFGAETVMTSSKHKSGSDRVAEVCRRTEHEIIINVQGDEPFISEEPLRKMMDLLQKEDISIVSLMHRIGDEHDIQNPNFVKVISDRNGDAIYFSRAAIPYNRDKIAGVKYWKHIGVYGFKRASLLSFVELPESKLEMIEKLEQLRLLENGYNIRMIETNYTGIGIDTPEDLLKAETLIERLC